MSYLDELFSLKGRVAIVSGGSRGLGAAIAEGLARAGASVVAVGRSGADQISLAEGIDYRSCDVAKTDDFKEVVVDVVKRLSGLDILVNAAGMTRPSPDGLQSVEDFEATLSLNLTAAYAACAAAAAAMKPGGSIINLTSIGSVLGFPDNPGYVAAKGGLRMMTRALAMDLASRGIRVNNLAPGYIRTEMTEASYADPTRREARQKHTILGRWGEPSDVIGAAIFLASDASSYVTGQDLFVDGGWTAKGLL